MFPIFATNIRIFSLSIGVLKNPLVWAYFAHSISMWSSNNFQVFTSSMDFWLTFCLAYPKINSCNHEFHQRECCANGIYGAKIAAFPTNFCCQTSLVSLWKHPPRNVFFLLRVLKIPKFPLCWLHLHMPPVGVVSSLQPNALPPSLSQEECTRGCRFWVVEAACTGDNNMRVVEENSVLQVGNPSKVLGICWRYLTSRNPSKMGSRGSLWVVGSGRI